MLKSVPNDQWSACNVYINAVMARASAVEWHVDFIDHYRLVAWSDNSSVWYASVRQLLCTLMAVDVSLKWTCRERYLFENELCILLRCRRRHFHCLTSRFSHSFGQLGQISFSNYVFRRTTVAARSANMQTMCLFFWSRQGPFPFSRERKYVVMNS